MDLVAKGSSTMKKASPYSKRALRGDSAQRTFSGKDLLQIAMPLGGLGAGNVCLNGVGGLQDFSIRHHPETSAVPDGHGRQDAGFALLHIRGSKPVTRLVEGPYPPEKIYNLGTKGQGHRQGGHEGLPRFKNCSFRGEYPFGYVSLSDREIPLAVNITGFSPFIPGDDVNSGIPCAVLEYTLRNRSQRPVSYQFSYHLSHLARGTGRELRSTRNAPLAGAGVHFTNVEDASSEAFGSAALASVGTKPKIKAMWFRGGWFDSISALWREVSTGAFKANTGTQTELSGSNGGSILIEGKLKPGESITYPVVIAWHFPNSNLSAGRAQDDSCCADPAWRPYYVNHWDDAGEVALYVRDHYDSLRSRTQAFHDALFRSTLPSYVLDAVSANLDILKAPTVLRQENGNVWGWEGCFVNNGCCSGTCTHVWNYAQALPHLFPNLERTLREQELLRSLDNRGHATFRAALPDGPTGHGGRAASDGQLGGIMKLYRDWQVSGDIGWLKRMHRPARKSLEYCIRTWDPKGKGILEEPHHNTYDIEFWGPNGMCSTVYIGALCAMAEIEGAVGSPAHAEKYRALAKKGAAYLDQRLYNGEYYAQKVSWKGIKDRSFERFLSKVTSKSSDEDRLLKREGPKYQYGSGCISDGVIGQWMATLYGIKTPLKRSNVRRTLRSIFAYNFKSDLSDHACTQRPGYAMGPEAGVLLCSWPKGGKPTLPFVYSDEVWTGIEYQVASHLILEGMVDEGLTIVKGVRDRHEGRVRNPWNEYECGNYYARAMASYALLGSLSGFRYSAADKSLHLAPKIKADPFRCFFSTAAGWGTVTLAKKSLTIDVVEGEMDIAALYVDGARRPIRFRPSLTITGRKRIDLGRS